MKELIIKNVVKDFLKDDLKGLVEANERKDFDESRRCFGRLCGKMDLLPTLTTYHPHYNQIEPDLLGNALGEILKVIYYAFCKINSPKPEYYEIVKEVLYED